MVKKRKVGLVLTLFRKNSTPSFCAMLPQVLNTNELSILLTYLMDRRKILKRMNLGAFTSSHFHMLMILGVHQLKRLLEVWMLNCLNCLLLIILNPHPVIASNQLAEAAESWVSKLSLKKDSGYPADSNPNPGNISFH